MTLGQAWLSNEVSQMSHAGQPMVACVASGDRAEGCKKKPVEPIHSQIGIQVLQTCGMKMELAQMSNERSKIACMQDAVLVLRKLRRTQRAEGCKKKPVEPIHSQLAR